VSEGEELDILLGFRVRMAFRHKGKGGGVRFQLCLEKFESEGRGGLGICRQRPRRGGKEEDLKPGCLVETVKPVASRIYRGVLMKCLDRVRALLL